MAAWVQVLGWVGTAVLVWSLLQTQVLRLRVLNTIGALLLLVFNAIIEVWPMVTLNAVIVAINLWHIWRLRGPITATGYDLLEVDPQDDYLRHVLRVHEEDILRFNPGFLWDPAGGGYALLLLRGNETVGVVLLRQLGATVARVELDYVTRRYRDFAPGRFLYRTTWFAEHGIRRLLANEDMDGFDDYFTKMGFGWAEGRLMLDIGTTSG